MNEILDENNNHPDEVGLENDTTQTIPKEKPIHKLRKVWERFQHGYDIINYMDVIVRAFASYFIISLYNLANSTQDFKTLDFPRDVNIFALVRCIVIIFALLTAFKYAIKRLKIAVNTDGYFLGTTITLYGLTTVFRCNNFYYTLGVALVVSTCMIFLLHNDYFKEFKTISKLQVKVIVAICAIFVTVYIATLCIYRYVIYSTSCYDFGIFCQMYYSLVTEFLPNTTCERNELLSHFAIHVSPIYYLLLPVYAIFQSPKTLLICQAIIVYSGVIPLYLICKNFKFSNGSTLGVCMMFICSPALLCSTFFDFHENKFLVPLLLWLLWAIDTNHIKCMYIFMALTLIVKEDAFIYVTCIALYVITSRKMRFSKKAQKDVSMLWHGVLMVCIALLYFVVVTTLMEKFGRGVMEYRYSNLMMDSDEGLLNVVKTVFLDPALAISEAFEEDKFKFFLEMVAPLLFLPFMSKKMSHVFLLVPFFIVNLMSDYSYQTQIGYQYVCGVTSMLVYLSVLNLHEMECVPKKYIVLACMCTSMLFGTMYGSEKLSYFESYCNNTDRVIQMNNIISMVPDDASVECTTYYVPQLSKRKELYMMVNPDSKTYGDMDFVIIKVGSGEEEYVDDEITYLLDNGYEFYNGYDNVIYAFVKSSYLETHPELLENQRNSPISSSNS